MTQYKLTKPYFDGSLHEVGEVLDFEDGKAPKGSTPVVGIVAKAKAAVAAAAVVETDVDKEDALLKSKK